VNIESSEFKLTMMSSDDEGMFSPSSTFRRSEQGYKSYTHKLDYSMAHMVLVTRAPGYIPCLTAEALWQELSSVRFTTPLKREWMDFLLAESAYRDDNYDRYGMRFRSGIPIVQSANAWGCAPGMVTIFQNDLDAAISTYVKKGKLHL
jgi:hypothetical protein